MYYNYYEEFEALITQGEAMSAMLAVLVALGVVRTAFEVIRYVRGIFKKNV